MLRCLAARRFLSSSYKNIATSEISRVGLIKLSRPESLNSLSSELFSELNDALKRHNENRQIGSIVITGDEKAFAGPHTQIDFHGQSHI